jgi:hypothetical protein
MITLTKAREVDAYLAKPSPRRRVWKMTNIVKITVLTVFAFVAAERCTQGAEPSVITLSCDGNLTNTRAGNAKPQPINKLNMVVNFADKTVSFSGHSAGIDKADVAHISFSGENNAVHGEIDRVTGATWVTTASATVTLAYKLLCKPAI